MSVDNLEQYIQEFKPTISPDFLEMLMSDAEFHQEICTLFEADCTELLNRMHQALEVTDGEELYQASHALKGIFSNTGFEQLKEIITPMMACKEPALLGVMQNRFGKELTKLEGCYEKALEHLKSLR